MAAFPLPELGVCLCVSAGLLLAAARVSWLAGESPALHGQQVSTDAGTEEVEIVYLFLCVPDRHIYAALR